MLKNKFVKFITASAALSCMFGMVATPVFAEGDTLDETNDEVPAETTEDTENVEDAETVTDGEDAEQVYWKLTATTDLNEKIPGNHFFLYRDANLNGVFDDGETKLELDENGAVTIEIIDTEAEKEGALLSINLGSDLDDSKIDMSTVLVTVMTDGGDYKAGDAYDASKENKLTSNMEISLTMPLAEVTLESEADCDKAYFDFAFFDYDNDGDFSEGDEKFSFPVTFLVPESASYEDIAHPRLKLIDGVDFENTSLMVNGVDYTDKVDEVPAGSAYVIFKNTIKACPAGFAVKFIDCEGKETMVSALITDSEKGTITAMSPWGKEYEVTEGKEITREECEVKKDEEKEPNTFTVNFLDCDGKILKTVTVKEGDSIEADSSLGLVYDANLLKDIKSSLDIKPIVCATDCPEPTPTPAPAKTYVNTGNTNSAMIFGVVLVVALCVGGFVFFRKRKEDKKA